MHNTELKDEKPGIGKAGYLFAGIAIGTVLGLLYAPQAGTETRSDLADIRRRNRERIHALLSKINKRIPTEVKAAAAYGAVKEGATEVVRETQEKITDALG